MKAKKIIGLVLTISLIGLSGCEKQNNEGEQQINTQITENALNNQNELIELDAFENITVNYDGIAPFATAKLDESNCSTLVKDAVKFTSNKKKDISNGDIITITADVDNTMLERFGYKVSNRTKEFIVDGLDTYVTGPISDFDLSQFEEIFKTEKIEKDNLAIKVGESGLLGSYFDYDDENYSDIGKKYMGYKWEVADVNYTPIEKRLYTRKENVNHGEAKENIYIIEYEINGILRGNNADNKSVEICFTKYQWAGCYNLTMNYNDGSCSYEGLKLGHDVYNKASLDELFKYAVFNSKVDNYDMEKITLS